MKFAIVNPERQTVEIINSRNTDAVIHYAGLRRGEIDFGTISLNPDFSGLSIIVYEFGLLKHDPLTRKLIEKRAMFSLYRKLYAGCAVIFAFDGHGETASLDMPASDLIRDVIWLATEAEVEKAISAKLVDRPWTGVNGKVHSQWPNMEVPDVSALI
jgi:hypothetical protein